MSQNSLPVIALVGRPNVGKSTLFNVITKSRDAIVADFAGLTRDRQYGFAKIGSRPFIVVDTGGLGTDQDALADRMTDQVKAALAEADLAVFVTDARAGLTAQDSHIADDLRRMGIPVVVAVNKVDGLDENVAGVEFHELGVGDLISIAASHGRGVRGLVEVCLETLPEALQVQADTASELPDRRIAVVGRPNVGKSTLINRLLGEERLVAFDEPGTTRDSVSVEVERHGVRYTLIDTAGLRRRSRVNEVVEKFSAIKTMQSINDAQVVIVMLDARAGVSDQDLTILGQVIEAGRAAVLAINKWDGLDRAAKTQMRRDLDRRMTFVPFVKQVTIAALHGSGLADLMKAVDRAYASASAQLDTHELSEILTRARDSHTPPMVQGRTAKLRYAHAGGRFPPTIVIHGSRSSTLPDSYKRYLSNQFRKALKLVGTPIRLQFRDGDNPYKDKKNVLTKRQLAKRRRLKQFTGKRGKK